MDPVPLTYVEVQGWAVTVFPPGLSLPGSYEPLQQQLICVLNPQLPLPVNVIIPERGTRWKGKYTRSKNEVQTCGMQRRRSFWEGLGEPHSALGRMKGALCFTRSGWGGKCLKSPSCCLPLACSETSAERWLWLVLPFTAMLLVLSENFVLLSCLTSKEDQHSCL